MSIKNKLALFIVGAVSLGVLITVFVTVGKSKELVIDEVITGTMHAYRDTVLNALTTAMSTGSVKEFKPSFLKQMAAIGDVRVVRATAVDKDYGKGETGDYARDDIEKEVLEKGLEKIVIEKDSIRGVYPYIAKADFLGKNCLACHNVAEGTVLGAVSIQVSLKGALAHISSSRNLYLALGLMGILAIGGLIILIVNSTLNPLSVLTKKVEQLADGDLRTEIAVGAKDEIGVLSQSMNKMIGSFNHMIIDIMTSARNVASSVDVMRARAEKTTEGAKTQSGQAHQIAAAAEEMSQTITDIAKNSSTAAESSAEAMEIAESGQKITDITVETISEVNASTAELAGMVGKLDKRVIEIGSILTVIKDIADQTNLLALNAAIEAARAGDQGRGFAVVADEVRKLAEKTIKATTEISHTINAVQEDSVLTMQSMNKSSKGVTKATGHIKNLNNVLESIVESIRKVRDQIDQIAAAVEEQSAASEEVANNIEKTSIISKDMELMSHDVLHEVNGLVKTAEELKNSTAGFKTTGRESRG